MITITQTRRRLAAPRLAVAAVLCLAMIAAACSSKDATPGATPGAVLRADHAVDRLGSSDDYDGLARSGVGGQSVVKFVVTDIGGPAGDALFLDSAFYDLHDEWFWFRLLNGDPVPGADTKPVDVGRSFATVQEVYAWAESQDVLPLDLRLSNDGRLYSNDFYQRLALGAERTLGLGSIVHMPEEASGEARPEYWLFELEYGDAGDPSQVEAYFDALIADLPPEIGEQLLWVTRSPRQVEVAAQLAAGDSPYANRTVAYADIVAPGQAQVYNPGIAAGRLLLVAEGEAGIEDARDDHIVVIAHVPDDLPAGNGLITADPQTPLAHVNLLARNRGIPNASLSGLLDDPEIAQLARIQAPVVVRASGTDQLDIIAITNDEYQGWRDLVDVQPAAVPAVDASTLEYLVDLDGLVDEATTQSELETYRTTLGGKAAGMAVLRSHAGVETPPDTVAITVRAYVEHLAQAEAALDAMLDDDLFAASATARYLALEGVEAFDERYADAAAVDVRDRFLAAHPTGSPLGDAIEAGGFGKYLRSLRIDADTLDAIDAGLAQYFGRYAPEQGLRFRSSSTVEDIEGFNGAGLYDSNTGFIDPARQPDEDDAHKTVEWALKKTWASYWGFAAFEEREREKIDHRSGAMAVLVHARFDDGLELANGVAALTYRVDGDVDSRLDVNAQLGELSVTNPEQDPSISPEIIRVVTTGGASTIERLASSSEVDAGQPVLTDAQVLDLAADFDMVAATWLQRSNAAVDPAQAATSVTLDFEFRAMAALWPAVGGGSAAFAERMVVKQVRTLDPGLRPFGEILRAAPIPRDVLAHAQRIERLSCRGDDHESEMFEVYTDPLAEPDLGFAAVPFRTATDLVGPDSAGRYATAGGDSIDCEASVVYSSPEEYLLALIDP